MNITQRGFVKISQFDLLCIFALEIHSCNKLYVVMKSDERMYIISKFTKAEYFGWLYGKLPEIAIVYNYNTKLLYADNTP